MVAEFERLTAWRPSTTGGWSGPEVAARFEAGARGEIDSELLAFGPALTSMPAARELLPVFAEVRLAAPVVLDYGCANGVYGELIAASEATRHWVYIGADVNGVMIESCRRRFPQRNFILIEDGKSIPLPDCSVDAVLASGVLETIEKTDVALLELRRVTRSLVVLYRIPCRPEKPSAIYWQTVRHRWGLEQHAFHVFNEAELHALIERAGLEVLSRQVSPASGEWNPPDDPEPVQHFLYVLRPCSPSAAAARK